MDENLIRNVPLFAGLTGDERQALGSCARLAHYQPEQQVFARDEACDALYLIQEGWVKLAEAANRPAVATLGPGSLLGETDFFQGGMHSMTALANTPVTVWVFEQDAVQRVINRHTDIGLKLGLALGAGIVQYRKHLLERVGQLSFLRGLDEAKRQAVVERLAPLACQPNDVVYRSGDASSGLYLVESGTLRLIQRRWQQSGNAGRRCAGRNVRAVRQAASRDSPGGQPGDRLATRAQPISHG